MLQKTSVEDLTVDTKVKRRAVWPLKTHHEQDAWPKTTIQVTHNISLAQMICISSDLYVMPTFALTPNSLELKTQPGLQLKRIRILQHFENSILQYDNSSVPQKVTYWLESGKPVHTQEHHAQMN